MSWVKGVVLREGKDITLIATGLCVSETLEAAKLLEADGIDARGHQHPHHQTAG